jgi:hypothetical protein
MHRRFSTEMLPERERCVRGVCTANYENERDDHGGGRSRIDITSIDITSMVLGPVTCPCRKKLNLEHIDGVARPQIGDECTRPVRHTSRRTDASFCSIGAF